MITIKKIAEILGVSPTTVSNVIHGKTKEVSRETIEKVNAAVEAYHYIPNMGARMLAQNYSKIIGVVIRYNISEERNALKDPFTGQLVTALTEEIRKAGYYMMLYVTSDANEVLRLTLTWNVDGLIVVGVHAADCQAIQKHTDKPVVFIDSFFYDDGITYYNVGEKDREAGYEMTRYLISRGHRRIAFLSDNKIGVDEERWSGYYQAQLDAGIPYSEENFIYLNAEDNKLEESLNQLLKRKNEFTALFFASDYYAMKGIHFLQDHAVSIPEQLSVVGFDDNIFGRNMRPALTTVHQDPEMKGKLACRMLIRLIAGEDPGMHSANVPTRIVIRDTVKDIRKGKTVN